MGSYLYAHKVVWDILGGNPVWIQPLSNTRSLLPFQRLRDAENNYFIFLVWGDTNRKPASSMEL